MKYLNKLLYAFFFILFLKFAYISYSPGYYPNHILLSNGEHFWVGWRIEEPPNLHIGELTSLEKLNSRPYKARMK